MSKMTEVLERQREDEEIKRRSELEQISQALLIDVEIVPFKDAKNRAALLLQCSSGEYRYALETHECYSVVESLLGQGFECRAYGKLELVSDERWQGISGCMSSWYVLVKAKRSTRRFRGKLRQ